MTKFSAFVGLTLIIIGVLGFIITSFLPKPKQVQNQTKQKIENVKQTTPSSRPN